jgi:hypothetical protein
VPGDRRSPVVADHGGTFQAEGVQQADDVTTRWRIE